MSDFLNLISAMAAGYLVKGWPFLLAHLLVAYLVSRSWHRLNRERRALESWDVPSIVADKVEDSAASSTDKPEITTANSAPLSKVHFEQKSETIVVLDQFVDESRVMGAKGLFVPMTDFSDRLDSAVEGKIAELHERTNLFLYVGIAGTMFGVFEFAHRSYTLIVSNALQSDKLIKLGEYLSGSMSRAFPVGFFGLVFTFIAQIIATRPEQRLREELSEATRKALEARKAATHSQGEIILKASADIGEAMAPLKNLEKTLSQSLKPVVEVFGQKLEKSLGLIGTQFERFETTSAGLQAAVTDVKTAVSSIAEATQSLNSLIKETPKVMNRLAALEKKHEESLAKSDALFEQHFRQADELSKALENAIGNLSTLSDRVIKEASEGIGRIETASVGTWTTAAKDLREKVEAELGDLFKDAARRMTEINSTVDKALNVMNDVGLASADSIAAVGKLAPEIAENYKVSLDKVGGDSLNLWIELSEKLFAASQRQYLAYLDAVQAGTLESSTALKNAATEWDTIARYAPQILNKPVQAAVAEARTDLESHITRLDTNLADRIRQFSTALTDLQNSINQLVEKVGFINKDLSNWAAAASPLTKDIRAATESIRRQSETHAGIVKQLGVAAEKIARAANRPPTIRVPTGGTGGTAFNPPRRERTWWKPWSWVRRRR